MTAFRPRFQVEALEDRLNPVTPADVFNAIAVTQAHTASLDATLHNPGLYTVATNAPSTRAAAATIEAQAEAAVAVLEQFMADLANQIQANPAASASLQVYLNQAATVRLNAQTNQGTAQLIVNFVDITNDINSEAQRALAAAIAEERGLNTTTTGTDTTTTTTNSTTTTTNTSGVPQNILDQLNPGGASSG